MKSYALGVFSSIIIGCHPADKDIFSSVEDADTISKKSMFLSIDPLLGSAVKGFFCLPTQSNDDCIQRDRGFKSHGHHTLTPIEENQRTRNRLLQYASSTHSFWNSSIKSGSKKERK